jgi:hypothetical protein
MSDPRFDRDLDPRLGRDANRPATPYVNRESTAGGSSIWVAAIVAILVVAGIVVYSYRGNMTASNQPTTTTGQSTRAPESPPPASAPPASATRPVAPATPADPAQRP